MPAPPPQPADRAASRLPQAPRSSWPADRGRTQGLADLARMVARLEAFAADSDPAKQAASATLDTRSQERRRRTAAAASAVSIRPMPSSYYAASTCGATSPTVAQPMAPPSESIR